MNFFKSVLATIVGLFVTGFIFFMFVLLILGGIAAAGSEDIPEVKDNTVLYINLSGILDERIAEDPFAEAFGEGQEGIGVLSSIEAIRYAKSDPQIEGIYLEHGGIGGGFALMDELRSALVDFKSSGKFIYSYGENYSEANYYLASVADEIYMNPLGIMEFNGLSVNVTFFKGLLDKLEIEPQIFRVGDYKSAVEPLIRKDMSEPSKEQLKSRIEDVYNSYLRNVSDSREIPFERLETISDSMLVFSAYEAADHLLITKVAYEDEMKSLIKSELDVEENKKFNSVSLSSYANKVKAEAEYSKNKVAVIVATGVIVGGEGETDNIGSDKFAKLIKKARENKKIKAVVIRVNSPGGSMLASEVIWREIMLTKEKKPVIASMSSYAASGGYYIAMPCDTIVAQPTTITGSIGVFASIFNFEKMLENKLGITNQAVSTGEFSDIFTVSRGLNDIEKSMIQTRIDEAYEIFTSKAAESRNMSQEDLKKVASGRVWTGNQAKERGLVDVLGSFQDAVDIAAAKAGIEDDYMVTMYPELKSEFEEIVAKITGESQSLILEAQYGEMAEYMKRIKSLEDYQGIQARMPFELEIQ